QHGTQPMSRLDTSVRHQSNNSATPLSAMSPHDAMASTPTDESGLSKRQLNQLKRKNKQNAKMHANKVRVVDISGRRNHADQSPNSAAPEPIAIRSQIKSEDSSDVKSEFFSLERPAEGDDDSKVVKEYKGPVVPEK